MNCIGTSLYNHIRACVLVCAGLLLVVSQCARKPILASGPVLLDVKSAWKVRERLNAGSVLLVYRVRFVSCDTSEQPTNKPCKA